MPYISNTDEQRAAMLAEIGLAAEDLFADVPADFKEALMIEPTECESRETMDAFIDAMIGLAKKSETEPETLKAAPITTPVGRLDETKAARQLNIASLA